MKCVLYISKALEPFTNEELKQLSTVSTGNNQKRGITGYLYYENMRFLQYMEGKEHMIDQMVDKIAHDKRHELLALIERQGLTQRRFPEWGMKNIADLMFTNSAIETTIIQTMSIFGENHLSISERTQNELFSLMDDLSSVSLKT
ncbi:BLUF domain-containing protein [Flagellimonas sp. HMM57]|uniref:BLUF domain-containing protein n=1 Tax=unclassified Flagellimonas TaxID=2644544 RepID=UPI0013D51AB1|nr:MULTISPECIES: BLUF domain-containing protein [unclassified Flagellimonas]UII76548.1 BLUF domain-containing protein [Flagellimonas sp. HMM57]